MSARSSSARGLLALVVVLDDLADVGFTLSLVRGCADAFEGVGRLDEDRVVDDNLSICPASREAFM